MATSLYLRVHPWCRSKYHDYVVFTKSIFCILGLILSYKLVEKTFLDILITILNNAWETYDLRRAMIVVNLQEGTTAVLVTLFAYAADVHTGRFKMLVFSSTVCIIGLVLNCVAAGNDERLNFGLFYPALVLMSLAQAAQTVTLRPFLEDQLRLTDPASASACDGGNTAWGRRSRFWWYLVSFVASIFVLSGPLARLDFRKLAIVLLALMGVCSLVFLLGTKYYNLVDKIENPFKLVGTVIVGAIEKRKLEYPQTPQELFRNSSDDLHIAPRVPWLRKRKQRNAIEDRIEELMAQENDRWLDRAAVVQEQEIQQGRGSPSSVEEVRGVKLLLKMLPLWFSFLTLSLVSSSGSTFFLEEAFSLIPNHDLTPILFFTSLQRFTEVVVSETSSYIIEKLRKGHRFNAQKMELVRIGIGMLCCVPCCMAAWATATARMQHNDNSSSSNNNNNNMDVYLLTPQYLLLGIMVGLSREGLESFYESQVSETPYRFGPLFGEFMMGVGKFTCMFCILIFSAIGWFRSELGHSRFDKYYILLAVLSSGNVVFFCLAACWYGDDDFLVGLYISHRSLYDRSVSEPRVLSISGDTIGELPEYPLLPSASAHNSWRSKSLS